MKKALFILGLVAAFFFTVEGITKISVKNAECAFCNDVPCYSSAICGRDCVCMKKGVGFGQCVSFNYQP